MITTVTESRYMPPWKAEKGYGEFLDENHLADQDVTIIAKWNDQGSPLGDSALLPPIPSFSTEWPLRRPDLIVGLDKPFKVGGDKGDVYRSFLLKKSFDKPTWVKAVAIRPGNPKVVHHVIVFMDATGVAQDMENAKTDGLEGFPDSGGAPGFIPSGVLATWAPGSTTHEAPAGAATLIGPKDRIVIQIHYHGTGKDEDDQTQLGLYFAKEPIQREMYMDWMMDVDLRIPAGDNKYIETYEQRIDEDMTVHTAFPHMHNLGQTLRAEARMPDGSVKPLIWVQKWDFRWQLTYALKQPMKVPKGATIHVEATYDNSLENPLNPFNPPKKIKFGKGTKSEMLLLILGYTLDAQHLGN